MSKAEQFDPLWTTEPSDDPALERLSLVSAARSMMVARRALEGSLPVDLIADPVVDVLMALYVARSEGTAPTAPELERATTVSAAVTRRWLAALAQFGLIVVDNAGVSLTESGDARVSEAIRAVIRSQIELHAATEAGWPAASSS